MIGAPSTVSAATANVQRAEAVVAARIKLHDAEVELARLKQLYANEAVREAQLREAMSKVELLKAEFTNALLNVELLRARIAR